MIKALARHIARRWMLYRSIVRLSLWRTLFVNFYFLPFHQAKKMPIYVYGKLKFTKLQGDIILDTNNVKRGMICMNVSFEGPGLHDANTVIILGKGKIIFESSCHISRNSKILIWGGGVLTLGNNLFINNQANIACCNSITVGANASIAHQVQIFDTNFHFTYGFDLKVHRNCSPVVLGHHTWVGARTTIMKGVELPPYTSIASNSLVNKSVASEERTLIGGSPAKIIRSHFSRVFSFAAECKIAKFFQTHPEAQQYQLSEPLEQYD